MDQMGCDHQWSAWNLRRGYLSVEGCFQCKARKASFSEAPVPAMEDYRDGDHFWGHLGAFPAMKFDLRCSNCSTEILLGDAMALMLCMACDPTCGVFEMGTAEVDPKNRVCVALCADTSHVSRKCISPEELRALNAYFDREFRNSGKRILVVPCIMRRSPDTCQGIVLADAGLAELHT